MMPVWGSMLRPVGSEAEKVRASPAAGAVKWLETSSEKAWPSLPLWSAMAVADGQMEALADRLTMRVGRGDRDRVVAEVAVGRGTGDDAGVGIDAEAGRQCGREGQGIAGGGSGEVAGDIEREGLAFIAALVCDGGGGRPAVADGDVEALADRLTMGVGCGDGNRVVAVVAIGRGTGDDAGVGIDAEARRK